MTSSTRRFQQTLTQPSNRSTQPYSSTTHSDNSLQSRGEAAGLRRRTYISHTLIFFNVLGIPLSFGTYLEFYYNSTIADHGHYPSLLQLSSFVAAQLFFFFAAAFPAGWLYQHRFQRTTIWISAIGAATCQGALLAFEKWWQFLLVSGVQGACFGLLAVIGTLCLATHYKNNIPLASMMCVNAGFLGAIVYTAIAYIHLQDSHKWVNAQHITIAVLGSTLFVAAFLIKPNPSYKRLRNTPASPHSSIFETNGTIPFAAGFCLLFLGIFVWPTYMILLISNPPGQTWPQVPTLALIATYGTAFVSASLATSTYLRRGLGPVNMYIGASIIAGACYLNPAWMPYLQIAWPTTIVFGACLGPILVLAVKVLSVFYFDGEMHVYLLGVLTVAGVCACLGIVGSSLLVEGGNEGFRFPLVAGAGAMILGGCLMGWARWRVSGRRFRVAI